ncbi:hypothetical protein D3C77_538210 [compost metagenome]
MNIPAQRLTDHCLARDAHQQRTAQVMQGGHVLEQTQVVFKRLGKAESRIQHDALFGYPRLYALSHTPAEKLRHLNRHIPVMRALLHGSRLTEHMHQANRHIAVHRRIQSTIATQGAHIVDQPRSQPSRFTDHRRCGRINGNHHIQLTRNRLDDRSHALNLLGGRYRTRARASRLAANIDQRRPRLGHVRGMSQG